MLYFYEKENGKALPDVIKKKAEDIFGKSMSFKEGTKNFEVYNKIKSSMDESSVLVIPSISCICLTKAEALKELEWFRKNQIILAIAEYPTTFCQIEQNNMAISVLMDVFSSLQDNPSFTIHAAAGRHNSGRKKIPYPDNWDDLYSKWKSNKITAVEFMKETGLKSGTFYHLASNYKKATEMEQKM